MTARRSPDPAILRGLVSVVIPAGSEDDWLVAAIESVLASQLANLEVVVVVNSANPAQAELPSDPRLRVVRFPYQLGVARANRKCLELARGEFIVHLDADDLAMPGRIEQQSAYLRANPDCVAVGSRVRTMDANGLEIGEFAVAVGDDVRAALVRGNQLVHSATTYRAAAVTQVNGYELELMEDYDLLLKLAMVGRVANLDAVLARYRIHGSQISRQFRPWGHYVRVVMRRRRQLGRRLGISATRRAANDCWYTAVQWGMYLNGVCSRRLSALRARRGRA